MKKWPSILIYLLIALGLCVMFCQCTPQKRLNRLHKNHPELFNTDTVYSTRALTVAALEKDTSFNASKSVEGLENLILSFNLKLDSLKHKKLLQSVTNYITERPCLDDTLKVHFRKNGLVRIWQAGGQFFVSLREPKQTYTISVPMFVYRPEITHKYNWQLFIVGLLIGVFLTAWLLKIGGKT